MKRKLFLLLVTVTLTMPIFADDFTVGGVKYYISDGKPQEGCSVSRADYSGDVVIPSTVIYNGTKRKVVRISERAFRDCTGLTSVVLPNSLTEIGDEAFDGCISLTSVTLPNSLTAIGDNAFKDCSALSSISLPNSLVEIGYGAFRNCSVLKSITLPNFVTIGDDAFCDCTGLVSLVLPKTPVLIRKCSFDGCVNLEPIRIEDVSQGLSFRFGINRSDSDSNKIDLSKKAVGAFFSTYSIYAGLPENGSSVVLDKVTVDSEPVSLKRYSDDMYSYILVNGRGVHEAIIAKYKRRKDRELAHIKVPSQVTDVNDPSNTPYKVSTIGQDGFDCCGYVKSITIPNSITVIGPGAFKDCSQLESISIPSSVTHIGGASFMYCKELKTISLPNSVLFIGSGAFEDSGINIITIPNSVSYIADGAFYGCKIASISLPRSVRFIGESAFGHCNNLVSATIPGSVEIVGDRIFGGSDKLKTVRISKMIKAIVKQELVRQIKYRNEFRKTNPIRIIYI